MNSPQLFDDEDAQPSVDEARFMEVQIQHRSLSDQILEANRALARLAVTDKAEEKDVLRRRVAELQAQRDEIEASFSFGKLMPTFSAVMRNAPMPPTGRGLVRQRHPNRDFFLADLFDYALKDDGASMEAPIFTLSTKPDLSIWTWTSKDGNKSIKVAPSVLGRATQHDKDVLIYVVSQLTEALNRGREDAQSRTVRFTVHDFLVTTNRQTSGEGYRLLHEAFERLAGTRVSTDIKTGGQRVKEGFGIIDRWKIIDKSPNDERMVAVEVTLSEWLYNAVSAFEVLTIHPDYFRLRKPLARRLYEIARKHCGHQASWSIGLTLLQEKAGSKSSIYEFRSAVKAIAADNSLPEYQMVLVDKNKVTFFSRGLAKRVSAH
ncbi:replication initiator protein A [Acidovorax sp. Root402]|uniref:replication initiator protein A n=1 Tax=Acidovorax sp. Root402 TaxID=1736527 RepID=UPI0019101D35|nr:replication initiator protein A [Acidovorax sp. Root402]